MTGRLIGGQAGHSGVHGGDEHSSSSPLDGGSRRTVSLPGAEGPLAKGREGRGRAVLIIALLAGSLFFSVVLATAVGVVNLPFWDTFRAIAVNVLGLSYEVEVSTQAIIWTVRLPRVLVAGLVGFGLAISGAAMQGLFRNPLASPGVTGLTSGASLGAVVALFLGWTFAQGWIVPLFAFIGAFAAVGVVYALSTRAGKTDIATLLLAGMAVSAFFSALISLMYHFVDDGVLRQIVYWLMGNLLGKRWEHVRALAPFVFLGSLGLMAFASDLNIMASGEDEARSLGVSVERTKRWVLALVSFIAGAGVSVTGMIGFVGLIVPHTVRLLIGPDHRWLLPASGLAGASFLILSDLIARIAFSPVELRTGIVTAMFGVPFFLYLLIRRREWVAWM